MNIVSIRSKYALAGNALRAFDCLDKGDVIYHTDETIRETLKKLRCTARYSPENLAEMQTDCGYSHHEENILLDEELNIGFASIAHLDWFHTWLQTGIFNYELAALMMFLAADPSCKITYEDIGAFVKNYETAKALPKVSHLFHANCVGKESVHFKCSASEALTLYPILALYFAEVVTACEPQRRSFLALCDVLDLLVCTKEGWHMVPPDMLDDAIVKHFRLMKSTYDVMFWTLKFHAAAMHIARQYRKHGLLVSLFTHERRHKLLKRFIRDRPNTTSFERGVMEEVTLQHLYDVRSKWWKSGCIDLRPPGKSLRAAWEAQFPGAASISVASSCYMEAGGIARVGDAVAFSQQDVTYIGEIHSLARVDASDHACLEVWEPVAGAGSRYYKVMRITENNQFMVLECLLSALTVQRTPNGVASCLIPAPLRAMFGD